MDNWTETSQFLMRHGLPLVFAAVLVEQMGLPIPALPLLLSVGALAAIGKFSLPLGIADIGGSALSLLAVVVVTYIAYKFWQRQRLLRELRMTRISVDELRRKQQAGEDVVILDLRSSAALEADPSLIPGAIHLRLDEIEKRRQEFPRDREIVVYCSCPNEATAARVAHLLQRHGFTRVRPLLGGIDAWREQNYPMDTAGSVVVSAVAPVSGGKPDAIAHPAYDRDSVRRPGSASP